MPPSSGWKCQSIWRLQTFRRKFIHSTSGYKSESSWRLPTFTNSWCWWKKNESPWTWRQLFPSKCYYLHGATTQKTASFTALTTKDVEGKRSWLNLTYYLNVCLEGYRKSWEASARNLGVLAEIRNVPVCWVGSIKARSWWLFSRSFPLLMKNNFPFSVILP